MKLTVELTKEQAEVLNEHAAKKKRTPSEDLVAVWWGRTMALKTYQEGRAAAPAVKRRTKKAKIVAATSGRDMTPKEAHDAQHKRHFKVASAITDLDSPEVALSKAEKLAEADGYKSEAQILKEAGRDHRTGKLVSR